MKPSEIEAVIIDAGINRYAVIDGKAVTEPPDFVHLDEVKFSFSYEENLSGLGLFRWIYERDNQ